MNTRETAEKYGVDPERLYDRYKKGDTLDMIQTRLRTTGQPEPVESKRCVNCRQYESLGCCDVFDVNRMLDLGLIDFGPPAETYVCPDGLRRHYPIAAIIGEDLSDYKSLPDGMVDALKYSLGVDFAKGDLIAVADPLNLEPCYCGKAGKLGFYADALWAVKCETGICGGGVYTKRGSIFAAEAWNKARIREALSLPERVEEYYPAPRPAETPALILGPSEPARDYEATPVGEWSDLELDNFSEDLEVADGCMLEHLGKVINRFRHGRDDVVFRKAIRSDAMRLCRHKANPGSGVGFTWA